MINPRKVTYWHKKFTRRSTGSKFYRVGFDLPGGIVKFSLRGFRTASEAEDYGSRLLLRWLRLYDAALVGMVGGKQSSGIEVLRKGAQ